MRDVRTVEVYLDCRLSNLASFFFFRLSVLSFFVKGLGFPAPLASPLMLLIRSPTHSHMKTKTLISFSEAVLFTKISETQFLICGAAAGIWTRVVSVAG